MIPELPGAVPEIPVSDVVAATEYYRDKLSFTVDWLDADIGNRFRVFYDFATPERERATSTAPDEAPLR